MTVSHHPTFEFIKEQKVESLNLHYQEFRHKVTGAQHIHLLADSDENVFMVALRTVPQDSKGVAHILEHTALSGSEKYPINDPFMSMTSRSLNTYMNAFTSSDWTAYPFATQNNKDFDNLLSVYLDAVFFPKLDPLAFAQEGHRLEFSEIDNSESDLTFKGVVFNEMKGVMSGTDKQLLVAISKHLYRTTTYHHNSGGNPSDITDLSYEEFKDFYKVHYHPSNAMFLTYGDISAKSHQQQFETLVLSRFDKLDVKIEVGNEVRFSVPQSCEIQYPIAAQDNKEDKTFITLSWLLGESTDLNELITTQLLINLLVGSSAAPLKKALDASPLGKTLAPVSGLMTNAKEMSFNIGLAGCNPESADALETLILNELEDIVSTGFSQEMVDGVLHQLELSLREVTGGSFPYGLQLIIGALNMATHFSDPLQALNTDKVLQELQKKSKDPTFFTTLIRSLLLDNPHRLKLVMKPSTAMADEMNQAEKEKLTAIQASLSATDKQNIIDSSLKLQERQNRQENKEILPKMSVADIPSGVKYQAASFESDSAINIKAYEAGTNGIVYQQIDVTLPKLTKDELQLLPIYTSLVSSLGVGEMDYAQTQVAKSSVLGNLSVSSNLDSDVTDANDIHGHLFIFANGLSRNQKAMTRFMQDTFENVRFDELDRIRDVVSMIRSRKENSVLQNGHSLAMTAAAHQMNQSAYINELSSGLTSISFVKALENKITDHEALQVFANDISTLHQKILKQPRQAFLVSEKAMLMESALYFETALHTPAKVNKNRPTYDFDLHHSEISWVTNTQVNFCAKSYPTVPYNHVDSAKLSVLANIMSQNFLHPAIREKGGAYGGGAGHNPYTATFSFYSYRDPRLAETIVDFDNAIKWSREERFSEDIIDAAILSLIAMMDKPESPSNHACSSYERDLKGISKEIRDNYRSQLLSVTAADLTDVANRYFNAEQAHTAVITNEQGAKTLGFTTKII